MSGRLIVVTGGVKSGKSRFALAHAEQRGGRMLFIATASKSDRSLQDRIARHRAERGEHIATVEEPLDVPALVERIAEQGSADVVLLDCVTVWLSNLLLRGDSQESILAAVDRVCGAVRGAPFDLVLVQNEVGLGVHPPTELGCRFADLSGLALQRLTAAAAEVYLAVAGVVLRITPGPIERVIHSPSAAQRPALQATSGLRPIAPYSEAHRDAALQHQQQLTKPPGSLGRLEELAAWAAGARASFPLPVPKRLFLPVFAADHGVAAEGVSAFPAALTGPIVANVLQGGAGVSVLARQHNVSLLVIDAGIATDVHPKKPSVVPYWVEKIGRGTRNLRTEDAMSEADALAALDLGAAVAEHAHRDGVELAGIGEVGIGNTTAAAALICAFTKAPAHEVVGRGTGIDDAGLERKIAVVTEAVARVGRRSPIGLAAGLGGFELLAMAGFLLRAASYRIPIVLDGVLASAAAVVATALDANVRPYLLAAHRSPEPGCIIALNHLQLRPCLELGMRLGEGTAAILGMSLLVDAIALQHDMATFASAGLT